MHKPIYLLLFLLFFSCAHQLSQKIRENHSPILFEENSYLYLHPDGYPYLHGITALSEKSLIFEASNAPTNQNMKAKIFFIPVGSIKKISADKIESSPKGLLHIKFGPNNFTFELNNSAILEEKLKNLIEQNKMEIDSLNNQP